MLTLEKAQKIVEKAVAKSLELDLKMNIAVVDNGANLVAFARMDGAWLGSVDIAIKKARTAKLFDLPTSVLGELSQPSKSLYGIEHSNNGLITFAGGLPIAENGKIVGAIGVSGSSIQNDELIASFAISGF